MSYTPESKRLTWDPAFPAPFESIWSIFTKVIILNNLTLQELTSLVKRKKLGYSPGYAINCHDTDWIDFDRFAKLLEIDVERLTNGTWRGMGITPSYKDRYSIRRCTECWKRGYHCVLFDLDSIATCPWHRCPLTRHCVVCCSPNTFSLRTRLPLVNKRFCSSCQFVLPERDDLITMQRFSQPEAYLIEKHCTDFTRWWRTIGERFNDRDLLLCDLMRIGEPVNARADYRAWLLGQAQNVAHDIDMSWEFSFRSTPVHPRSVLGEWVPGDPDEPRSVDREPRIRDTFGKCYRSLRKHLYKSYVRPHRRCHRELKRLNREQSLTLDGDEVCRVALAFLIWRMSVEGVVNIEGLRFHRSNNFTLRLMSPYGYYGLPPEARLRWSYFSFFSIWRQLENFQASMNVKFRFVISGIPWEGGFPWVRAEDARGRTPEGKDIISARFALLFPDISGLLDKAALDCRARNARRASMLDTSYVDIESIDNRELLQDEATRRCLFQARLPQRRVGGARFWHINV